MNYSYFGAIGGVYDHYVMTIKILYQWVCWWWIISTQLSGRPLPSWRHRSGATVPAVRSTNPIATLPQQWRVSVFTDYYFADKISVTRQWSESRTCSAFPWILRASNEHGVMCKNCALGDFANIFVFSAVGLSLAGVWCVVRAVAPRTSGPGARLAGCWSALVSVLEDVRLMVMMMVMFEVLVMIHSVSVVV